MPAVLAATDGTGEEKQAATTSELEGVEEKAQWHRRAGQLSGEQQ